MEYRRSTLCAPQHTHSLILTLQKFWFCCFFKDEIHLPCVDQGQQQHEMGMGETHLKYMIYI